MDIIEEEVSNVQNGVNIETLPCIKDGVRRLAKIYYWPAESGDSPDFKALCEFVIFNVGIKRPFFEKLLALLLNRVGNLCQLLLNSIDDDTPQITYEEAYVLLRKLRLSNTRDLINKFSCSSNMFNGILKSIKTLDYDLFLSSLHESDNKKMMQVLWEMRYILYGIDHYVTNIEPIGQIKIVNRWVDSLSYDFNQYFYHYTQLLEMMSSEEEVEKRFIQRRLKEIVGIPIKLTRRYVETVDFGIDKQYVLVGNFFPSWLDELKEIDNVNVFIKSLKSDWITSRAESLAKSILTRNVISHSKEIVDKFNYDYSVLDEEAMNSLDPIDEEDMEILRNYILLYTNEMLYIYNKVKNILDDDSKNVLISILNRSKYTELFDTSKESSAGEGHDNNKDKNFDSIIQQWKSLQLKTNECKTFKPCLALSDSEIDNLLKCLKEKQYISERSTNGKTRDVLKGKMIDKQCKGFEPILWEKRSSRNKSTSKSSVINFLRLLGVKDEEITIERLNLCFICPDGETYVQFDDNNLYIRKGEKRKSSEYNDDLMEVIESVLGGKAVYHSRIEKLSQTEKLTQTE